MVVATIDPNPLVHGGGVEKLRAAGVRVDIAQDALAGEARQRVGIEDAETLRPAAGWRLLMPLQPPECWASGVTYERSRDARADGTARDSHQKPFTYDDEVVRMCLDRRAVYRPFSG